MKGKELALGCERALAETRVTALKIVSPAQLVALETMGYRIVPEWMPRALVHALQKAPGEENRTDAAIRKED